MDLEQIQTRIKDVFGYSGFVFEPEKHRYTLDGQYMPSVTGVAKQWKKPFDRDGISQRVADRDGIPVAEVLKQWENKSKVATELGTEVHELIEAYWDGDYPLSKGLIVSDEAKKRFAAFLDFRQKKLPNLVPVAQELKVFSRKYWVAGTLDLLAYNRRDGKLYIFDWKTNGKFRTDMDRAFDQLLPPFEDLWDNDLNSYSIQLSLYQLLLKDEVGIDVEGCALVHLPPGGANPVIHMAKDFTDRLKKVIKPRGALANKF